MPFPHGITLPQEQRALVAPSRGKLLREHDCDAVTYPDGATGTCRYTRLGPVWHRFDFRYSDNARLPYRCHLKPLGNQPADIETKARELAEAAFYDAIEQERKDRFARVSEPTDGSRKKNPAAYQITAAQAKRHGGKYALCLRIGNRLLRVSASFATIAEANELWKERNGSSSGGGDLVVACCNRLDRRWEIPRYNPLHREMDFRKGANGDHATVPCW